MRKIGYGELRDRMIRSENPLFFEYTDLTAPNSSEEEIISYLLDADDPGSVDFLFASRSKYDKNYISVELFCGDDASCGEADTIIRELISENPGACVTVYDSNGKYLSRASGQGMKPGEISKDKSYVFDEAQRKLGMPELPPFVTIRELSDCGSADEEIEGLVKALPDWQRHVRMSYNSLGKVSDAFYILKKDGAPVGFLCNLIHTADAYRDVSLILVADEHRGQGMASLLAKYYVFDTLRRGKIPLYSNAENAASERVAEKAGFRYRYSRAWAEIEL